jgi:MFS family permease
MSGSRDENATESEAATLATSHDDPRLERFSPRLLLAQFLGLVGVVLYNWWVWVIIATNLLTSTNAFFSDLEATGRPDAALFQHLDLAAGVVTFAALIVRGPWGPLGKRAEWRWLLLFAVAGAVGGHFAYACPEGLSSACRSAEWHLRLPLHHYLHVFSGIIEFAAMTTAIYLAWKRTREHRDWVARTVKAIAVVGLIAYPVLGVAYLTDRFGSFIEPIFFICFSMMVAIELLEPRRSPTKVDERLS